MKASVPARLTFLALVAAVLGLAASARPAAAQQANDYAKIIIHLVPTSQVSRPCTNSRAVPKCSDMIVKGGLFPDYYYAFLCVTDGDATAGIAGLQCGIDYSAGSRQGVDVLEWHLCATLEFNLGDWPAAHTGNLITWSPDNTCQRYEPSGAGTGVTAVAGYFYVAAYSADKLKVIVRPVDGYAKVADCGKAESVVEGPGVSFSKSHLGYAAFSENAQDEGYNPCGLAAPKEETTWSDVKTRGDR